MVRPAARLGAGIWVLCSAVVFAAAPVPPAPPLSLRWLPPADGAPAAVELAGLAAADLARLTRTDPAPSRWQEFFAVFAEPKGATPSADLPPMLGTYRVFGNAIRFEPQFPLHPGVVYRAELRLGQSAASTPVTARYELPAPARATATRVSAIYPSGDVLPENLLKFYLHFSAPMRGGDVYRHIHLRNGQGREVALPFLQIGEELWSPDMTRLTLLLDPGRIKRGLRLLAELGPALEAGGNYTLVIDRAWSDAAGLPLAADETKSFHAAPADRTPLDPATWTIRAPAAGSRAALEVAPGEAIERALALRLIRVFATEGGEIEGDVELTAHESLWRFVPDAAWRAGDYRLVVAATIEDLAGNNVGKPFDVDVFDRIDRRIPNESVSVPFSIR